MPTNRKFGLFFGTVFITASIYFLLTDQTKTLLYSFSSFGLFIIVIAVFKPSMLTFFNLGWYRFGLLLGRLVSPFVLAGLFFFLITPIGLILKLTGRDPLSLNDLDVESYWVNRPPHENSLTSFKDQF